MQHFGARREERFHDLRVAERLGYKRGRVIRELIERRRTDLERVGVLLFVPEARYGTAPSNETANGGLAPGKRRGIAYEELLAFQAQKLAEAVERDKK